MAANRRVTAPNMLVSAPSAGRLAAANIASTVLASLSPIISFTEDVTCRPTDGDEEKASYGDCITTIDPRKNSIARECRALAGIFMARPISCGFPCDCPPHLGNRHTAK